MNALAGKRIPGPVAGNAASPKASAISKVALFGEFGPPLLAAARSFRDAGIEVVVLGLGKDTPLDWSNAISFAATMPHEQVGTPSGLAYISDFLERTKAQALLPFWDPEMLWLAEHQHLLPAGCKLLSSSKQALERVHSKNDQLEIAGRSGFRILPTWKLLSKGDITAVDPGAFPVCLRPSVAENVHPGFKAEVLQSPSELKSFLARRTWGPEPLLVQPFLSLPTIVVHGVRSESGELLALEAFIPSMRFEGISLELLPMHLNHRLVLCCRNFADEAEITGPFHFDLLYSAEDSTYHYLEVNARLGGTTDKVLKLGFEEPLLALSAYGFDVPVKPYRFRGGRPIVNRRALLKHIRALLRGYLSPLDFPVTGRLPHLLLSLRSLLWDRDSIASTRDLRGTWYFYFGSRYAAKR
ncbi:MAG: hypothetical protein WA510_00750 [Acidobacteriaceae bacterium]